MAQAPQVKQVPGKEVPPEIIATSIEAIAKGTRKLMTGRLTNKAVYLLIQHACPARDRPSIAQIRMVFEAAESLERTYLKKQGK